jgi:hypothetical protein
MNALMRRLLYDIQTEERGPPPVSQYHMHDNLNGMCDIVGSHVIQSSRIHAECLDSSKPGSGTGKSSKTRQLIGPKFTGMARVQSDELLGYEAAATSKNYH